MVILLGFSGFIIPVLGAPVNEETSISIDNSSTDIIINATAPEVPASIPVYRATVREGDVLYKALGDVMSPKENVTSEQDAPEVAENVMEQYGGLPTDAVFAWSETNYLEHQTGTGEVISKKPVTTTVAFGRRVNGLSLDGDTDGIRIELGSNGEPLEIRKTWRTLTYSGNVSVIPATKAVEKLLRGEIMKNDWRPANVSALIDIIRLRYYQKGDGDTDLEPVWVFIGETKPGDYGIKFIVYARHFANFTASSTNISTFQSIQFTDTSETTPTKWYWDFGDGTNSSEQNPPSHMYRTAGNFTVNLTA
ncbi:MAG: PKD domain-containing protein, partial [Methanoregula sp.]|nr:PKD domain-containing protein [Methanoregula sp.]